MKKTQIAIILLLTIFAFSCNENRVYEELDSSFPKYRWDKEKVVSVSADIADINQAYKLFLSLRHVHGFQFSNLNLKVEMISPSKKTVTKSYVMKVVGADKKYLSECNGDLCDLETLMEDNFKFEEVGKHIFKISHEMKVNPVPNVMMMGIAIDKIVEAGK